MQTKNLKLPCARFERCKSRFDVFDAAQQRQHSPVSIVGWGQSWLFGKPAVSGFSDKKTAGSGFLAGFLGDNLRLRISLITYIDQSSMPSDLSG